MEVVVADLKTRTLATKRTFRFYTITRSVVEVRVAVMFDHSPQGL